MADKESVMNGRSKLLKVVSILSIIFGILGVLGNIILYVASSYMGEEWLMAMGTSNVPNSAYAISAVAAIFAIVAGIMGIRYKSRKNLLIIGAVVLLIQIIAFAQTFLYMDFSPINLINFVLPILYLWGVYQSE